MYQEIFSESVVPVQMPGVRTFEILPYNKICETARETETLNLLYIQILYAICSCDNFYGHIHNHDFYTYTAIILSHISIPVSNNSI